VTGGGRTEHRLYDSFGVVAATWDGHEGVTRVRRNAFGDRAVEELPTGARVERAYWTDGTVKRETVTDADGALLGDIESDTTSFGALATLREHLTVEVPPAPAETRLTEYRYDASGKRIATLVRGLGWETLGYDAEERLVRREDAAGNVETYGHDGGVPWPSSQELLPKEGGIKTTTIRRDSGGNPLETHVTGVGVDLLVGQRWDEAGNLLGESLGGSPRSQFAWDSLGKLLSSTRPGGSAHTAEWDLDGLLLKRRVFADAGTWQTTYTWDAATGRLQRIDHPDGTSDQMVLYDPDGALRARIDRDGNGIAYNLLDAANRVRRIDVSPGPSGTFAYNLTLAYDGLSRVTRAEREGSVASRVERKYDVGGRLQTVLLGTGIGEARTYDGWDGLSRVEMAGGRVGHTGGLTMEREFVDPLRRPTLERLSEGAESLTAIRSGWPGLALGSVTTTFGLSQGDEQTTPGYLSGVSFGTSSARWGDLTRTYRPGDAFVSRRDRTGTSPPASAGAGSRMPSCASRRPNRLASRPSGRKSVGPASSTSSAARGRPTLSG
jgi:YD repeat-containing protein